MSSLLAGGEAGGGRPAPQSIAVPLTDSSSIGAARRTAGVIGGRVGLSVDELSNLSIVVSELAGNALRHAVGGLVVFRSLGAGPAHGVEVLCIDRGPGMHDVERCFRDGFSTGGTMGTGLGAARRLATAFDIFSRPGQGTIVLARLWSGAVVPNEPLLVGALALPLAGETRCGDGWAVTTHGPVTSLLLVDGLGHGAGAADAAALAIQIFRDHPALPPTECLAVLHQGLRATRGAAAAIAQLEPGPGPGTGQVRFAGIGNIAARIVTPPDGTRSLVSHNGIVGLHSVRSHEFTYPFPPGAALVMHSDGVTSHWKPEAYPGLLRRDPAIVAGLIHRDFSRGKDDSSVVVCRHAA